MDIKKNFSFQGAYDFLVVGAGFAGATFARIAHDKGYKVLLIEKENFIGGHCRDIKKNNVFIHLYGPHIFHCADEKTWNFVNRFSEFIPFSLRTKVNYNNKIYSFPINLMTFYQVWGIKSPQDAENKIKEVALNIENPQNFEEFALSKIGEELYNIFYFGYTKKQWKRPPSELPAFIFKRIPIRYNFDDNYFPDDHIYCGMPKNGYAELFNNLTNGIETVCGVNYLDDANTFNNIAKNIVYTGSIDELLDYKFGKLDYLSLEFEHKDFSGDYQGNPIINYTSDSVPYVRSIEWKHFYKLNTDKSFITLEYPANYESTNVPYYPINDTINNNIYDQYLKVLRKKNSNIILSGRLAKYKYLNMNEIILDILELWNV